MKHEISTEELHELQVGKTAEVKIVESYMHQKFPEEPIVEPTEINLNVEIAHIPKKDSIIIGLELNVETAQMDLGIKGFTEIHLKENWKIKHVVMLKFMQFSIFPRLLSSLLTAMNVNASLIGQRVPFEPQYLDIQEKITNIDPNEVLVYDSTEEE